MKIADKIISIVMMLFCVIYFNMSLEFSARAKFWPQFMILSLFLLSTILLINSFRKGIDIFLKKSTEKIIFSRLIGTILLSIFYIFSIYIIGFFSVTFIYIISTMYFLGTRNIKILLFTSILSTLLLYIGFKLLLEISVPKGILL